MLVNLSIAITYKKNNNNLGYNNSPTSTITIPPTTKSHQELNEHNGESMVKTRESSLQSICSTPASWLMTMAGW